MFKKKIKPSEKGQTRDHILYDSNCVKSPEKANFLNAKYITDYLRLDIGTRINCKCIQGIWRGVRGMEMKIF